MSEEEKKAIEALKSSMFESVLEYFDEKHKILLKLTENQQKEIEELKEDIENWKFTKEWVEKEYISKQKIKDKIDKWDNKGKKEGYSDFIQGHIETLEELLEEE